MDTAHLNIDESSVGQRRSQAKISSNLTRFSSPSIREECTGFVLLLPCRRKRSSSMIPWENQALNICIIYSDTFKKSTRTRRRRHYQILINGNLSLAPPTHRDKAMVCVCVLVVSDFWMRLNFAVSHLFHVCGILSGYDCGVFTCMFADFLSKDCPLLFTQHHVDQCRQRIALSIMRGKAII